MFTGIITDVGTVRSIERTDGACLRLATAYDTAAIDLGASIACSGACLTVIDKAPGWFAVDVSNETLTRTTLAGWNEGTPVNLERALRLGDELGGHLVSGHVDGVGRVVSREADGGSARFVIEGPQSLAQFVAEKGSIAVDGVSLTVNRVDGARFDVNIIPHTLAHTTLDALVAGDRVNLEIDMLARYVARLREAE